MGCPKGVGCGGSRCRKCLEGVDLNEYVVFYSERPEAFKIAHDRVSIAKCSGFGSR